MLTGSRNYSILLHYEINHSEELALVACMTSNIHKIIQVTSPLTLQWHVQPACNSYGKFFQILRVHWMFLLSYCVLSSLFLSLICSPTLQLVYFPNATATRFQAFFGKSIVSFDDHGNHCVHSIERFPTTFMQIQAAVY